MSSDVQDYIHSVQTLFCTDMLNYNLSALSLSLLLRVNLDCRFFPISTERCIYHGSCGTLVPPLKAQFSVRQVKAG